MATIREFREIFPEATPAHVFAIIVYALPVAIGNALGHCEQKSEQGVVIKCQHNKREDEVPRQLKRTEWIETYIPAEKVPTVRFRRAMMMPSTSRVTPPSYEVHFKVDETFDKSEVLRHRLQVV